MTAMIPSDAELLRLMLAGDHSAFATLYRRHQGTIYRFALLMSGVANIAEEVTQEVFLMLIREPHRYDPARGPLLPYLCGVARNFTLRALQRERPYVPLAEGTSSGEGVSLSQFISLDDPFGNCTRNEVIRLVQSAVLTLPTRYREVVVLCDFQELSCADAAAALGCAIGTVSSRLHRGHALLLKKLRAATEGDAVRQSAQRTRCFA
jgi:RNA polymerase sigma-70 factor, ECF subfamily